MRQQLRSHILRVQIKCGALQGKQRAGCRSPSTHRSPGPRALANWPEPPDCPTALQQNNVERGSEKDIQSGESYLKEAEISAALEIAPVTRNKWSWDLLPPFFFSFHFFLSFFLSNSCFCRCCWHCTAENNCRLLMCSPCSAQCFTEHEQMWSAHFFFQRWKIHFKGS